jgi:hypothetical protein
MEVWQVRDELSTDLSEVKRVVVRIVSGEVAVTAGEQPRIDVRRDSGADVHVELRGGVLEVSQPEPGLAPLDRFIKLLTEGRRHRCTIAITAPGSTSVDLTTVSADVLASGFDDGTRVKTVSGDVTLNRLAKEINVKTVSGDVDSKDITGGLRVKTVSGDVGVVDGSCRWVDAKGVSGDVLLDLDLDPSGTYDISTVSGDVAVRTTSEPNLYVDASSISGDLVSDFGLGWDRSRPGRKHISEAVGSGGARLWVKTVSGDLRVLRGREAAA